MPAFIHERAKHILAKNPEMETGLAFALATQQSHALGKSPKKFGTLKGRRTAKKKYDKPGKMTKAPNPGKLQTSKLAFIEALPVITGLASGYGPGRNIAGETAAATAPKGRVQRSDNIARNAAAIGVPLGGLGAMALAHKFKLAPRLADFAADHFRSGLIADSESERELIRQLLPGAAAIGGSLAGGAATGAAVGGLQNLRGPVGHHQKTAAHEDPPLQRPGMNKLVAAGMGGSMLAGVGHQASTSLMEDAVRKELASPDSSALYDKVLGGAKVPVGIAGVPGAAFQAPGLNSQAVYDKAGLGHINPDKAHVLVNPQMRGSPSVLAHELGHADIHSNRFGRLLQNKLTSRMGAVSPLIGLAGGLATGDSENATVRNVGAASGLLAALPQLGYEAAASLKGYRNLKSLGASADQLKRMRGAMLPAFGTYLASAGVGLGNGLIGSGARRTLGDKAREKAKEADAFGDENEPQLAKAAFGVNQYSGVMNPPTMKYQSGIPPWQEPPVKTAGPPTEKKAGLGDYLTNKITSLSAPTDYVRQVSAASGIPEEHVRPYVFNIRPQRFKITPEQFAKDLKPVYDIKETMYNPLQQGLVATPEGSPEEAEYLKQHKGNLDKHYQDWMYGQADLRKKYTGGDAVGPWAAIEKGRQGQAKLGQAGMMPLSRLESSQSVGAPKVSAPPGPSIAQISKPTGWGRPISGAAKGNHII